MAAWGQTRVSWLTLRHEGKRFAITLKIATLFNVKVNRFYGRTRLSDMGDLWHGRLARGPNKITGETPVPQ